MLRTRHKSSFTAEVKIADGRFRVSDNLTVVPRPEGVTFGDVCNVQHLPAIASRCVTRLVKSRNLLMLTNILRGPYYFKTCKRPAGPQKTHYAKILS